MKMRIELHNLKPKYMSESEVAGSDIYLQPSVLFEQGRSYLVRARSGHGKTSLLNFIYGISGQYDGEVVLTENGERRTENGERRAENATHPAALFFVHRFATGTATGSSFSPLREGMANARTENELRTRVLSFMFQDLGLFPQLTAMENVQLKNRLTDFKSDAEIEAMLDALLPEGKKHQPVATLSLGQRQRVAAVRALCQPFKFILMDEPFSHIDSENARCVADMVMGEVGRQGAGLIVTALDAIDYFPFDVTYNL